MGLAQSAFGRRGKSKFGNTWTEVDGIKFQSKLEAKRYVQLKGMVERGEIRAFERQPKFELVAKIRYVGDFLVTNLDGSIKVEDVKGVETEAFKLKRKLFNHFHGAQYGELVVLRAKDLRGFKHVEPC